MELRDPWCPKWNPSGNLSVATAIRIVDLGRSSSITPEEQAHIAQEVLALLDLESRSDSKPVEPVAKPTPKPSSSSPRAPPLWRRKPDRPVEPKQVEPEQVYRLAGQIVSKTAWERAQIWCRHCKRRIGAEQTRDGRCMACWHKLDRANGPQRDRDEDRRVRARERTKAWKAENVPRGLRKESRRRHKGIAVNWCQEAVRLRHLAATPAVNRRQDLAVSFDWTQRVTPGRDFSGR